jgi:hypothetical protein
MSWRRSQFIHIYEYPSRVEVVIFSYIISPFPHPNRISFLDKVVIFSIVISYRDSHDSF